MVSDEQWDAQDRAWDARVKALGVARAIYHNGHDAAGRAGIDRVQYEAIVPHLLRAIGGAHLQNVLDFGCGHGRWSPLLADKTGGWVLATDPTMRLLEHAEAVNPHPRVQYHHYQHGVIRVGDQPIDRGSIDLLWCCMVLSTILDPAMFDATIAELRRVLKPGAIVCLTDNTSKVGGKPVRSPYSISRTVAEYEAAFDWADLQRVGEYVDLNEINTVFLGRVR